MSGLPSRMAPLSATSSTKDQPMSRQNTTSSLPSLKDRENASGETARQGASGLADQKESDSSGSILGRFAGSLFSGLLGTASSTDSSPAPQPPLPQQRRESTSIMTPSTPANTTTLAPWNFQRTGSMSRELGPQVEVLGREAMNDIAEEDDASLAPPIDPDSVESAAVERGKPPLPPLLVKSHSQSSMREKGLGREDGGKLELARPLDHGLVQASSTSSPTKDDGDLADPASDLLPSVITQVSPSAKKPGVLTPLSIPKIVEGVELQTFSKATIAWAFAQITGQFTIDSHYLKKEAFDGLRERVLYKTPGQASGTGSIYGGGSLARGDPLAAGPNQQSQTNTALPLYNTPPTILFCDLELGVGESKSFKYEILLPSILPPSHRGKVMRFTYKLLIGIQKDALTRVSQVVSIPFRFFNRTNADGTRPVFEIQTPVISVKDQAHVTSWGMEPPSPLVPSTSFLKSPLVHQDSEASVASARSSASKLEAEYQTSSADNIMHILQASGKVSYDICKNNDHICQLSLSRLGYRLGESVTAVLHFSKSSVPCYHVSAYLESHETVEAGYTMRSRDHLRSHTRVLYGEFHQHTVNSKRTAIVLNIPSKATPDLSTSCMSVVWSLRFEFITGLGQRVYYTTSATDGFVHSRALPEVDVEPFDCTIPLKVYGALKTSKQQKKVLDFAIK
ncbi:hypothetical protein HDV03_001540 [Kappamyces sp. JEL0829]|nr:hypothetical protein HDV03_001540 [Kappamyces sp. JEL0829]